MIGRPSDPPALDAVAQVFMVSSLFVYERKMQMGASGSGGPPLSSTAKGLVASLSNFLQSLFFHHNIVLAIVAVLLALVAEWCWLTRDVGLHLEFSRVAGTHH